MECTVPNEIHSPVLDREHLPVALQSQSPRGDYIGDPTTGAMQPMFLPSQEDDVIHVAQVILAMELLFHVMVQVGQIEVGQELTGVIADGDAGMRIIVDYPPEEPKYPLVLNAVLEFLH